MKLKRVEHSRWRRVIFLLVAILAVGQIMTVIGSWLLSAAMPDAPVNSLLSVAGIRWFFNHFTSMMATPFLVWSILVCFTCGAVYASGYFNVIFQLLLSRTKLSRRHSFAFRVSVGFIAVELIVVGLLCLPEHAILLSVTGNLWSGGLSESVLPCICFIVVSGALIYGVLSGTLPSVESVGNALCSFATQFLPFVLLYIECNLLVNMLFYVF